MSTALPLSTPPPPAAPPLPDAALARAVARGDALLLAVTILHLLSIWAFPYFPSQDGPSHLGNAAVLRQFLGQPAPVFGEYYVLNRTLAPGWLAHAILAGLMGLVPPLVAEKLLLSAYAVLLPLCARYALRSIHRGAVPLAALSLPFVFNYLLHMGFYAFALSLPLFWFSLGCWIEHRARFTLRAAASLTAIGLALYACHPLTLLSICLSVVVVGSWQAALLLVRSPGRPPPGRVWRATWTRVVGPVLALAPALVLLALFVRRQGSARSATLPFGLLSERLLGLDALVSYDPRERWLASSLVLICGALVAHGIARKLRRRRLDEWDGFLLAAGAYLLAYYASPSSMAGGGWINERLSLFVFFVTILWLGAQRYRPRILAIVQFSAAAVALGLLGLHARTYDQVNQYLHEYLAGAHLIEPNSTVLPLCFSYGLDADGRPLSEKVAPFLHPTGHIVSQKPIVDLNNYEASKSYFPLAFRRRVDPFTQIGIGRYECTPALLPPQVEFLTYPQRTGGRVDYVLVWGATEAHRRHPDGASVFRQLEAGYELLYTSPRWGLMQLYGVR